MCGFGNFNLCGSRSFLPKRDITVEECHTSEVMLISFTNVCISFKIDLEKSSDNAIKIELESS